MCQKNSSFKIGQAFKKILQREGKEKIEKLGPLRESNFVKFMNQK